MNEVIKKIDLVLLFLQIFEGFLTVTEPPAVDGLAQLF